MPFRNEVPTLQLLCIRQLAFPENLVKKHLLETSDLQKINPETFLGQERRVSIFESNLHKQSNYSPERMEILLEPSVENLINAWIRLSDYYETRLDDIKHMRKYLSYGGITTLDFLHQGFSLHDGTDVTTFAGVIPSSVPPQHVTPYTWREIVKVLGATGNIETLKTLYIHFGFKSDATAYESYRFKTTFISFKNLTKLVVHGSGNDNLMMAIGICCPRLKHLDIRKTEITEKGIINLLLKSQGYVHRFDINRTITYPAPFLNPLTKTLQYFDMSTVPKEGLLLSQCTIVRQSCPQLLGTPTRFFFYPTGIVRFHCVCGLKMDENEVDLRNQIMSKSHTAIADHILNLTIGLRTEFNLPEAITSVQLRVCQKNGDELSLLYFHRLYVIVEFKFENLTIISLTSHAKSSSIFIPLELLVQDTPKIKQIKASLKGSLSSDGMLINLERVTAAIVHTKETLLSIIKFSPKLVYIEIREMLLAKGPLDDDDILEIFEDQYKSYSKELQVFRILFKNKIHLVPGLKEITSKCPCLRVIGDLKYWKIPMHEIFKFSNGMSSNNYEIMFEYQSVLYHTNTPCKEFYR